MPVHRHRLAVAAVIAATVIAVPAAALASVSATSSGKPTPSAAVSKPAAASKSAATGKPTPASGSGAAIKSAARRSGALRGVTLPAEVAALATQLGVSHAAAQQAFNQLDAISGQSGVDPTSPAFATIAHDLGVSPAQLAAALDAVKRAARQSAAG